MGEVQTHHKRVTTLFVNIQNTFMWCIPERVNAVWAFRGRGIVREPVLVFRAPYAPRFYGITNHSPAIGQSSPRNPMIYV